jgi:hypothetical protein
MQKNEGEITGATLLWDEIEQEKGQIYTRPEVVDFMLAAMGLVEGGDFEGYRILEPSCGEGDFVVSIARLLIGQKKGKPSCFELKRQVLAIDVSESSLAIARAKVRAVLVDAAYSENDSDEILDAWFLKADYLLADLGSTFTHIVGNPPYIRVESIPKPLLTKYRAIFSTMTDRADIYIAFFEKSLNLLKEGGRLSFICTDRWTKNRYGRSLRSFISEDFSLELFVDLYGVNAFESEVMTYPAITQFRRSLQEGVVVLSEGDLSVDSAQMIFDTIEGRKTDFIKRDHVVNKDKPWLLRSMEEVALIHRLEAKYPLLEDAECEVFIGTATGANAVYIVQREKVRIEDSRLLKVITARELKEGRILWKGNSIINTYDENGVIDLSNFPLLRDYLNSHRGALSKRHIAVRSPKAWYKTIDRVYAERAACEKLLIPDIGDDPIAVYDAGEFQPNNSIYYICSTEWNLHALRVLLLSRIGKLFIATYSTKISSGYMRYQAQHLRRICLPRWGDVDKSLKARLIEAGQTNNSSEFTKLSCELYGLTDDEISIIGG